ncbi:uncharacterized protein SPPG_05891 [Spizellomyces punctatus DAOM BR117]|uniref:OsmC family protein n=1 Tax=Spizellomyces punctatus (strain DAOM BR117) TaxID=645134 RepID=A0A0L0HDT5_SPIPD|nr:uncharacterized protein SPPG_05891 [Spizellomyces punctatus DAOM BR117]KNC98928.1 hypothetical protein SPPG_05891 [Spizellomyces punctatus DAOM BR117]|eukprot:XP_016606968.1 hypothetical protein SPPG_05891 [Spizellomyces punctatus DAOM BR117]
MHHFRHLRKSLSLGASLPVRRLIPISQSFFTSSVFGSPVNSKARTFDPNRPVAEVQVAWTGTDSLQFLGQDASGNEVLMSASKAPGVGPMAMLLMGLGGCSAVDIVGILQKQRQSLEGVKIRIEGQRAEEMPRPYENIHMTFIISGKGLDKKKVDRAIELAAEKYCGVHATLKKAANITLSSEIIETGSQ